VSDPYAWPGSDCLANKLGIKDPEMLAVAEARLVSIRDVQIARLTIPGDYGITHLQSFHRTLFGDVYEWAGAPRTVDIAKPGAMFCHWRFVEDQVNATLGGLASEGFLVGYNQESFVRSLAHYYGELNVCHMFREGNGRAHRAFLRQLAAAAGYQLDWSELSRSANVEACRRHLQSADLSALVSVLTPVVRR
jgi:cell filamentation protein